MEAGGCRMKELIAKAKLVHYQRFPPWLALYYRVRLWARKEYRAYCSRKGRVVPKCITFTPKTLIPLPASILHPPSFILC